MSGKEYVDMKTNSEIIEKNIPMFAELDINVSDAKSFWNDKFNEKLSKMSFEELCDEMLWRSEDEFDFDIKLDESTLDALEKFQPDNWELLDTNERHDAVKELVKCISDIQGLSEVPEVEFIDDRDNSCGFYSERGNYIGINERYLDDPKEIVDTIAHETRHAYQHYRGEVLETPVDEIYKFNFEHYIAPEYDADGFCTNFFDYYDQYVEVEARAFANEFAKEVAS